MNFCTFSYITSVHATPTVLDIIICVHMMSSSDLTGTVTVYSKSIKEEISLFYENPKSFKIFILLNTKLCVCV